MPHYSTQEQLVKMRGKHAYSEAEQGKLKQLVLSLADGKGAILGNGYQMNFYVGPFSK